MKRKYTRKEPHNKLTPRNIMQIRSMLELGIPKSRIAMAMGISRRHLYRVIQKGKNK